MAMLARQQVHQAKSRHQFTDYEITQVSRSTRAGIARWVSETAEKFNIRYFMTATDPFAREASRLSDAEVEFDQVENLLLALSRAGVLTQYQSGLLHAYYLRHDREHS